MKFQLEDIDLTCIIINFKICILKIINYNFPKKIKATNMYKKITIEKDCLEEDLNTVSKINELVKTISYPHQVLIIF